MKDQLATNSETTSAAGVRSRRDAPAPPPGTRPGGEPGGTMPGSPGEAGGWSIVDLDGRAVAIRDVAMVLRDGVEVLAVGTPRLLTGQEDSPVFSMTALLAAEPDAGETSLVPLVEAGQLALEASCRLEPAEIDALSERLAKRAGPPPGAETTLALADGATVIDERSALGTASRIALSGRIGREAAIEVMNAMNEAADAAAARLVLGVTVRHRASGVPMRLRLRGRWAVVWDALALQADRDGRLAPVGVDAALMQLLGDGRLTLTGPEGATLDDLSSVSAMFARVSGFVLAEHPLGGLMLRDQPTESFPLDVTETRSVAGGESLHLETRLALEIARLFRGRSLEAHLGFVALAAGGGRQVSQPRRIRSSRRDTVAGFHPAAALALSNGHVLAAATAFRPAVTSTPVSFAHNLAHDSVVDLSRPVSPIRPARPRSLPIVTDAEAARLDAVLRDRVSSKLRWYVPDFTLAEPEGDGQGTGEALFRFEIERIGVTQDGTEALAAELVFRLAGGPPEGIADEVARLRSSGTAVRPVVLQDASVALVIPYVDSGSGRLRRQRLACEAAVEGEDIACRVGIANQWVRIAYGALSRPGFQSEPATVEVAYRFESYAPVDERGRSALIGSKLRRIGEIRHDTAEIRIERRSGAISVSRKGLGVARPLVAAQADLAARPGAGLLAIRPQLELSPAVIATLSRTVYAERTRQARRSAAALVSCNRHPGAYLERSDAGTWVLGCQDALSLGRGEPALLEEIVPLGTAAARVFRLITQADVFLVLPARYRLTRRNEGGMQVPAMALYSILDAEMDDNTRFVFDFTLQPALSPAERRELMLNLAPYSPGPVLRYPGEMPLDDVDVSLLVGAETLHANDGPFLDLSVSGDLTEAVLVKSLVEGSGLGGSARFTFGDATALESAIDITIASVAGPWDTGPVEAVPDGRTIRLRNCTESRHEVTGVLAIAPFARIAAARSLASGESVEIDAEARHGEAYAIAAASEGPGSIDERRAFIEDVRSSVIFMALVDFEGLSIASIEVDAEIVATGERHGVSLSAALPAAEVVFRLPITQLLSRPKLRFSSLRVGTDGSRVPAGSEEADLSQSAVIQITAGAGG